jgi:hypothetical protein
VRPENWSESFVGEMMLAQVSSLVPIVVLDYRIWPDSLSAELTDWLRRSSTEGQHLATREKQFFGAG